ncbi:S-4TM family putative pore-forming effector [Clostridium sp. BL-8]|uniref:S-4TM family putative pore-forming effector n=1 Tax=Clostridium sp. BL-8 TaxID=349938 RepID=UPI00098C3517|nr:S-4TM family putative pore-forming effector [Clostridium sp. BL-8]OOM69436.1 hypothetical protein CLOBL_52310 [Clostridium sp. BL-8]
MENRIINNEIINKENLPGNLDKLYAQRQIYSDAKVIFGIQIVVTVVFTIVLSLVSNFFADFITTYLSLSTELFKAIIFIISALITILDLIVITPYLNNQRILAASIQDSFDCDVLSISNNPIKISKPDVETIGKYSLKFIKKRNEKDKSNMINWYYSTNLDTIKLPFASIMCQRTNCWWDNYLRQSFVKFIISISTFVFLLVTIISLFKELSIPSFLLNAFSPFFCLLTFTIKQYKDNCKSINNSNKLKACCDNIWADILNKTKKEDELKDLSRKLQDEIFQSRSTNPLIFDWYYKRSRNKQEYDTNYTLEIMIKNYNSSINKNRVI